jgi:hypothetical protein
MAAPPNIPFGMFAHRLHFANTKLPDNARATTESMSVAIWQLAALNEETLRLN